MSNPIVNVLCYSYKGGSGRSTAAVNIAFELARQGNLVACLDMDIGAPGLHMILSEWNPGVEDLVKANDGRVGVQTFFNTPAPKARDIDELAPAMVCPTDKGYLSTCLAPVLPTSVEPAVKGQLLFVFCSTRERTITDLSGDALGQRQFMAKYKLLQQGLAERLAERARRAGSTDADRRPVYIVVDGPNGITPVSLQLLKGADLVLMFYRHSLQHVKGTAETARKIRAHLYPELQRRRLWILLIGSCVSESLVQALLRGGLEVEFPHGYESDLIKKFREIEKELRDLQQDYGEIRHLGAAICEDEVLKTLEQPLTRPGVDRRLLGHSEGGPSSEAVVRSFASIATEVVDYGNLVLRPQGVGR
jgi:MinD-like ATPase involved in chromosome partitioning or flagellar assembly